VSERVDRPRELYAVAAVARVLQVTRLALYRTPKTKPAVAAARSGPPADEVEAAIVEVAEENPTDGW
jgi:hypothetical protein